MRGKIVLIATGLTISMTSFGVVPLTRLPSAEAAFPGRNGLIIFDVRISDPVHDATDPWLEDYDLFTVSVGGAGLRQLTQGPEADLNPDWSPDGRSIAFRRKLTYLGTSDIYVMDADGTNLVNLTPNTLSSDDWGPAWSPDGSLIAFNSSRGDQVRVGTPEGVLDDALYVMDADGSDVRQVADQWATGAEWSPDGAWIAVGNRQKNAIEIISVESGEREELVRFPARFVAYPDWSPDGSRLVFASGAVSFGGPPGDIWLVNRDGSGLENLTRSRDVSDVAPNWSPDGRFIVFVSNRSGADKLYRMNADGTRAIPLVDIELAQSTRPDWGPRP